VAKDQIALYETVSRTPSKLVPAEGRLVMA